MFRIFVILADFVYGLFYRARFIGRKHVPPIGEGVLVCANHTDNIDPILTVMAMGKKNRNKVLAKEELFRKGFSRRVVTFFGAYPIKRGTADITAIKNTLKYLKDGWRVIVFPEGTRVKEGVDSEAKAGAGMFALRSGCRVLPIYITPHKRMFRKTSYVVIGEPYKPALPEGMNPKAAEAYLYVADDIMDHVRALANDVPKK